ncbi:16782_t:CDS:2, partial [Funneliformis caledonium]
MHSAATSVKSGTNNKTLFLYGGMPINDETIKDNLEAIVDDKGLMYLFSGHSNDDGTYFNDMLILDTAYLYDIINDSWNTKITLGKVPSNRSSFSAVLGSLVGSILISLESLFLYRWNKNKKELTKSILKPESEDEIYDQEAIKISMQNKHNHK